MLNSKSLIAFFMFLTLVMSCEEPPTEKESKLLKELQQEYRGKYVIDVYDATYLKVYAIDTVDSVDIIRMSKKIKGKFPNVRWAYINVYNKNKKFLYQLIYNPVNQQYIKSEREYY